MFCIICLKLYSITLDCWPRLLAHSFDTGCWALVQVLCLGSCPRFMSHVNGENPGFLVQFHGPGFSPKFLAWGLDLGSCQ